MAKRSAAILPAAAIESGIISLRGIRVIFDEEIARLYGVPTKVLIQAVKRNLPRFPSDFMFQLTDAEFSLRSQIVTSKSRGGRRYAPYAFTEQGVAMLSSVLTSRRAIAVNIEIMRAFVRLRAMLGAEERLMHRIAELEGKYDEQFRTVFDAIYQLMEEPEDPPKPPIGFHTEMVPRQSKARLSNRQTRKT